MTEILWITLASLLVRAVAIICATSLVVHIMAGGWSLWWLAFPVILLGVAGSKFSVNVKSDGSE